MRIVAAALLILLAGAESAQAGAWLREKGGGFSSVSVATDGSGEYSTSVYLEYGLSDRFTLGGDFYYGSDLTTFQSGSGIVFVRFPLGPTDQPNKWAAHLGAGTRYYNTEFYSAAEIGVSWGRGFQWRNKYGWMNIDATYNDPQSPAETRVKVDGTVGLGLTDRSKVMLQMFNTFEGGEEYIKLAPSYLFSPGGGSRTIQLSIETPLSGGGETYIKIGLWREF